MSRIRTALVAGLALSSLAPLAIADDIFVLSGTANGNAITPVGSDNLINLVNDAVNNVGRFTSLLNTNASLSLNYGGVSNAISIDKNAANSFASLSFVNSNGSRTTRTFDTTAAGANGRSLQQLIEDYLKKDGSSDLKQFYKAMNAQTEIAVSDGNPNATSARMADFVYDRFGRYNRQTAMFAPAEQHEDLNDMTKDIHTAADPQMRFSIYGGTFSAGDFDGDTFGGDFSMDWNFTPRVGLTLGAFWGFNTVGDADVYHLGIGVGVPIRPILPTETCHWTWQITPSLTAGGSGSEDMAAGGLVYSPAVTSLLRWDITPRFALEMANQIGYYTGEQLTFSDFTIDPGVDQTILKNGLEAELNIGESGWYAYGGASYTNFLNSASVSSYITPDIGVGWRKGTNRGTSLEFGFTGSFGDNYTSYGGRVAFNFAF